MKALVAVLFSILTLCILAQYGGPGECPDDGSEPNRSEIGETQCYFVIPILDEFGIKVGELRYDGYREVCDPSTLPVSCSTHILDPYCYPYL